MSDLAWILYSPSLIKDHAPNPQSQLILDSQWHATQWTIAKPWLDQLDTDPQALNEWMDEAKDRRLGSLFERLLLFWIRSDSSPFNLISNSLQIIENKHTLGELDFVVQDKSSGQFLTIEVAVKFYIGIDSMMSMDDFVGPRVIDRLGRKWRHLKEKQSKLHQHPAAQNHLMPLTDNHPISPKIFIKGRLFIPFSKFSQTAPHHYHPFDNHYSGLVGGWHLPHSDLNLIPPDLTIRPLQKLEYFAPLPRSIISDHPLHPINAFPIPGSPVLCALIHPDSHAESSRGWITPNHWPIPSQ